MSTQPQVPIKDVPGQLLALVNAQTNKVNRFFLWVSHYVKSHERLLAIILASALIWGVSGKALDFITAHDLRKYDAAAAARSNQAQANVALAQQNATLTAQYQTLAQQAQETTARLEDANAKLADALSKQKATDATLPPSDLANRIEHLASIPAGSVTPQAGNSFAVTNGGAVGIAQTLESVPSLQQTLANTQQEKLVITQLLQQQSARVDGLNQQVGGLKLELSQADTSCKAQIKVVKDDAAKGKRKWFEIGYIAGLATRGAIKIFSGV